MSQEVLIDVDFYNKYEEEKFKENYPEEYQELKPYTNDRVKVSFEEFKAYSQFHQVGQSPLLNSYCDISENISVLWGQMPFFTQFDPFSCKLTILPSAGREVKNIQQSIGNAGILSFLGAVYNLTQADWRPIKINEHSDFDFDSAVIGDFSKVVIVEAKGSMVSNNQVLTPVSSQKGRIQKKKKGESFRSKYKNGADLLIGGITAADPKNHLKLWLVDPPVDSVLTPLMRRKIKLLKRLSYYHDYLNLISSRSQLAITLANRISVISKIENVAVLDKLPLTSAFFGKIDVNVQNLISTKSHIGNEIIGSTIVISESELLFIGLPVEMFHILVEQDQEEVLLYKSVVQTFKDFIVVKLDLRSRFAEAFAREAGYEFEDLEKKEKDFWFQTRMIEVNQTSSGLCYSRIQVKDIENLS